MLDFEYIPLLKSTLEEGFEISNDRTGTGTKKLFGKMLSFPVSEENFPIIRTKFVHFKSILVELLWMMNGDDNTKYLRDNGVTIWDEWADEDGSLNGVYGKQWREWKFYEDRGSLTGILEEDYIDQLQNLIDTIKNNPNDRRQLVSAWNVGEIDHMNLPPCHYVFQTFVRGDTLDLMINQRSCDLFLGVPFNLTSYSLLLVILAKLTNLKPGRLTWVGGDCHIYSNHSEQVETQLERFDRACLDLFHSYAPEKDKEKAHKILKSNVSLNFSDEVDFTSLDTFLNTSLKDPSSKIYLSGYNHLGKISAPVAV